MEKDLREIDYKKYTNPANISEALRRMDKRATKGLGQNFLVDSNVVDRIAELSGVDEETAVIEIGPGMGALTACLIYKAKSVTAIELDNKLENYLLEEFSSYDNFELIMGDVLKVDLAKVAEDKKKGASKLMLLSNLPYHITTPILMTVLERELKFDNIVVMVQLELADRMNASFGNKDYGALSVNMQSYASVEKLFNVKPNSFMPKPKVSSAVIEIRPYNEDRYGVEDRKKFMKYVKAAFHTRRKKLVNSINDALAVDKEVISDSLKAINIREDARAEMLSVEDFVSLIKILP